MSVKCICIDDKGMPSNYRQKHKWVKKDAQYHIIKILYIKQSKTLGFQLAEIDLSDNFPYTFFASKRFGIPEDQLELFLELMKKCKDDLESDEDISEFEELLKTTKKELVDHE